MGDQLQLFGQPPVAKAQVRTLRPYQTEAIAAILDALNRMDRILLSAATGSGKTIISAELARVTDLRILFIADASELVYQARDKISAWIGEEVGVEMAGSKAAGFERVIVGTTQSMCRRLKNWNRDDFDLIIIDEAHRNTLGAMAQKVLNFFNAKVVGITATPFRSDKQQLGTYYEDIVFDIGLAKLIPQGYLAPITVKQIPVSIDLRDVGTRAGDYREEDLDEAITPYLGACADMIIEHAPTRRVVAFLPLIKTSQHFCEICRGKGLNAVHVDGKDRESLHTDWQVICNSALLTTGWDEPSVDCVLILRPTKSLVLYSQMVGRGTRIHPGKKDLLLLDPLYMTERHDVIRPVRLFASTDQEAKDMEEVINRQDNEQLSFGSDLLEVRDIASNERHNKLVKELEEQRKKKRKTIDLLSYSVSIGGDDLADWEPTARWEGDPLTEKQVEILSNNGFDPEEIRYKGLGVKVIDTIMARRNMGLCSPKQMKWLIKFNHPNPSMATFSQATKFLDLAFNNRIGDALKEAHSISYTPPQ